MSYRWLEHTSELELQIDAASEEAVFALAVAAVGELVGGEAESGAQGSAGESGAEGFAGESGAEGSKGVERDGDRELTREVAASAGDRATLLAAFLEELVYLIETDDLLPQRTEHVALADGRVTATVHGRRGSPRHLIKGVTYHQLTFTPNGSGFVATVVLDV